VPELMLAEGLAVALSLTSTTPAKVMPVTLVDVMPTRALVLSPR
jgi:hypothetical protein